MIDLNTCDDDVLVYGQAYSDTPQLQETKTAKEGFIMRLNNLGAVEFLTEVVLSKDMNDEVTTCSTE